MRGNRLRVGLTAGHSEWLYDHAHILRDVCGFDVKIIGGFSDHKRPEMKGFEDIHRKSHEVLETHLQAWEHRFVHDEPTYFLGGKNVPSIQEWMSDRGAVEHINRICDEVDCLVHLHPRFASIYYQTKPSFWQLHGGENRAYWHAIQHVHQNRGQVVCYTEASSAVFGGRLPVIRFGKNPEEYRVWTGEERRVLYLANRLRERAEACNLEWFSRTRIDDAWSLAGTGNETFGRAAKEYSYDALLDAYSRHRIFFNLGTKPAPITLGTIEAAMGGCPILTGHYESRAGFPSYQVPMYFAEGCKVVESRREVLDLLDDYNECKRMSEIVQEKAVELFDWKESGRRWSILIERHMNETGITRG